MTALTVNKQPNLSPQTYAEMREFAKEVSETDFCPKAFRGKVGDVMVAIQFGSEVGLAPLQALQNLAVINGKPSIYGDGLMALAQSHPACEYINEWFDDKTMTAFCESKRRGAEPKVSTFSKPDAELASLWGKRGANGQPTPWVTYPKRMLQMRARGFNLRDNFADALKGLISREEAMDYPTDITAETIRRDNPALTEVIDNGMTGHEMEMAKDMLEKAYQDDELAEVWKVHAKEWFDAGTLKQQDELNDLKNDLKTRVTLIEGEANATVALSNAADADGTGSKPEPKRRGRPPKNKTIGYPTLAELIEGMEASATRGMWWDSFADAIQRLKPEEIKRLEQRSIELDEKEGL